MRLGIIAFLMTLAITSAFSQTESFFGNWVGKIDIDSNKMLAVMFITKGDTGGYSIRLDFPEQGVEKIKISNCFLDKDSIYFDVKNARSKYYGLYDKKDSTIKGKWNQLGKEYPLIFSKTDKDLRMKRPQTPVKPYPYSEEEVVFDNPKDGIQLTGTLTIPEGAGPFPAVVFISGSGQQERDCEILGHKWALVLADHLTRQGIATLRYDDRGVGKSGGNPYTSTTFDFAEDAASAMLFLRKQDRIDKTKTGLIGHSEGGIIAPMIASKTKEISFLVLLAAPGIDIIDLMVIQNRKMVEGEKILRQEQYTAFEVMLRNVFKTVIKTKDNNDAGKKIMNIYAQYAKTIDSVQIVKMQLTEKSIRQQLIPLLSPWYRYFLSIKPSVYVSKVKCPVLALNGDKDIQVTADENLAALNDALRAAGNIKCTVRRMNNLNHLFQTAVTGMPEEYAKTEETISPEVLDIISKWIKQQ